MDPLDEALNRLSPLATPTLTVQQAAGGQPLPESTESAELLSDCGEIVAYRHPIVDPPVEGNPCPSVTLATPRTQDHGTQRTCTMESFGSGLQEALDGPSCQRGKAIPIFRISEGPNLFLGDHFRVLSTTFAVL